MSYYKGTAEEIIGQIMNRDFDCKLHKVIKILHTNIPLELIDKNDFIKNPNKYLKDGIYECGLAEDNNLIKL